MMIDNAILLKLTFSHYLVFRHCSNSIQQHTRQHSTQDTGQPNLIR